MTKQLDAPENDFFRQQIERLEKDISRAARWGSPAIYLAIYDTAVRGAEAVAKLEDRLARRGQQVVHIAPDADGKNTLVEEVSNNKAWGETVFFVMHLSFSIDENLYEMVSARSDFFINNHIRIIYWITEDDFATYVSQMPEDWGFTHRFFPFVDSVNWQSIWAHIATQTWNSRQGKKAILRSSEDASLQELLSLDIRDDSHGLVKRARLLTKFAIFYYRQKRHQQAAVFAAKALELAQLLSDEGFLAEASLISALIQTELNQSDDTFHLNEKLLRKVGRRSAIWNQVGALYWTLYMFEDALRAYQNALDLDRHNPSSWCGLGKVLLELDKTEKALTALQQAIALRQNFPCAWRGLGRAYSMVGNIPKAVESYQRAVEIDDRQTDLWLEISQLGDADVALFSIRRALDLEPERAASWNLLGNIQYAQENFSAAIRSYYQALSLEKTLGWAYANMALIHLRLKEYNKAVLLFLKSSQVFQNDVDKAHAFYRLGNTYQAAGKFSAAARAYREAARLFEKRTILERHHATPGPIRLETAEQKAGDAKLQGVAVLSEKAKPMRQPAVQKGASRPKPQQNTLARSKMLRRVLETNKRAKSIDYWLELGMYYIRTHMYDLAEDAFQVAMELEPENGWSYFNLGLAYMFSGSYDDAVPLYEKSIQLFTKQKDKALSWNQLGNAYRRLNEHSLAVAAYERARVLDPAKNSMMTRARLSLLSNCYVK